MLRLAQAVWSLAEKSPLGRGRRPALTLAPRRAPPSLERLEDRCVMTVGVSAALLPSGLLRLEGTKGADVIDIRQNNGWIGVEGIDILYQNVYLNLVAADRVGKIEAWAYDGDDVVRLDRGHQAITVPARLMGGVGDDLVIGGAGSDILHGEGGHDTLIGGAGDDSLYGGGGKDLLYGDAGLDFLFAGSGDDTLFGGHGDDRLFGEHGFDRLYGDAGNDWLEAGSALEFADGGSGTRDWNAHLWSVNGTQMDDVRQYLSPTCSFHATLASLAQHGVDLDSRISYLGNYTYRIALYKAGVGWTAQDVRFDGTLYNTDAQPAVESESWVILFQRAFLQHRGVDWRSSTDVNRRGACWPWEAQQALLGQNVWEQRQLGDPDLARIQSALQARQSVVTATWWDRRMTSPLLVRNHAYTVVAVERLLDPATNTMQDYITVRNPWGFDGGSQSYGPAHDGIVKLSWTEFKRQMQALWIC